MTWWIVTTGQACERRAIAGLADLGLAAWTPMRLVKFKTRHMRAAAEREYPSFPSYVFVDVGDCAGAEEWHRIRAVQDVRAILTNAGRPVSISDVELDRVRAHLDDIAAKPISADVWRKDDLARISDVRSPFYGQVATVARGDRRGSVSLLLSLFGRQTATEVAVDQLERAA